jgi:hypothetical protein
VVSARAVQRVLPSGRKLSYPQPYIIGDEREQHVVFSDNGLGQFKPCRNGQGAYKASPDVGRMTYLMILAKGS